VESQPLLIYPDYGTGRSSEMLVCFRQMIQSNGSRHNYSCQALSLKNKLHAHMHALIHNVCFSI